MRALDDVVPPPAQPAAACGGWDEVEAVLEIALPAPTGAEGEELDVQFQEVAADQLLDGFGVGARLASTTHPIADLFENHRSVYTRLATLYPSDYAFISVMA